MCNVCPSDSVTFPACFVYERVTYTRTIYQVPLIRNMDTAQ